MTVGVVKETFKHRVLEGKQNRKKKKKKKNNNLGMTTNSSLVKKVTRSTKYRLLQGWMMLAKTWVCKKLLANDMPLFLTLLDNNYVSTAKPGQNYCIGDYYWILYLLIFLKGVHNKGIYNYTLLLLLLINKQKVKKVYDSNTSVL